MLTAVVLRDVLALGTVIPDLITGERDIKFVRSKITREAKSNAQAIMGVWETCRL